VHFFGCENLKNIKLSDSVTSIGESAFGYCMNLEKFVIPFSVKEIGKEAFESCVNLEDVYLPNVSDVEEIKSLKYIKYFNNILNSRSFHLDEEIKLCTIHMSNKLYERYKDTFSKIKNIIVKTYSTLDDFLDSGKSFKEINKMFKQMENSTE